MYQKLSVLIVVAALGSLVSHEALGGRGGGFHGGGGGGHAAGGFNGGGNYRAAPSGGHSPSFSMPRQEFHPQQQFHPQEFHPQEFHPQNNGLAHGPENFGHLGIEPRPEIANHPALGVRPTINNRTFNNNHLGPTHIGPTNVNVNRNVNNFAHANYGNWYHGDWHDHWDHPWNHFPNTWWGPHWWGWGAATAAVLTAPWAWGYWNYYNPYYVADAAPVVDYSQPLLMAGGAPPEQTAQDQAMQIFQQARDRFQAGDYPGALTLVDQALAQMPSDPVMNEFRALTLFAEGDYHQAAATLYAVLSVGPGWDWTTLSSMYADTDVYTQQLRALENFIKQRPNSADARFVLAYQYLTCGYTDQAATQLRDVVRLNPKDQLSAQLLTSISAPATPATPDQAPPPDQTPATPPPPVAAANLAGNWTSTRPDGGKIALDLTADGKYKWAYTAGGQTHDFAGTYDVADGLLILKQDNNPTMVGQVTPEGDGGFNFKMAGGSPNDPGLTFRR